MNGFRNTKLFTTGLILTFVILTFTGFALDNSGTRYYFSGLFEGFELMEELEAERSKTGDTQEFRIKEGIYYFIQGTAPETPDDEALLYLEKCLEIFDELWRNNRSDNLITLYLAYAYTGVAGKLDTSKDLETIMHHVFKARNLFTIVIQRLPDNIDPRLGRTRINMNLSPQTGRPDAVILEDAEKYFEVYAEMEPELQVNPMYYLGLMEMRLAAAQVYHDQKRKKKARELFEQIDEDMFDDYAPHLTKMYRKLAKSYGK